MRITQHEFSWGGEQKALLEPSIAAPITNELHPPETPAYGIAQAHADDLPIPKPLREAVSAGVFGLPADGPIEPDEEQVTAITEEHANELMALQGDIAIVEDSIRDSRNPRTGRVPNDQDAKHRLAQQLQEDERRLKTAYADAIAVYADAFGQNAATALDEWARKAHAGIDRSRSDFDPGHPWHYYRGGDDAAPMPADVIPPNIEVGQFIENELPKNPAKREQKLCDLLDQERRRVEDDKRRYQDIAEKGAAALSQYDREIAHGGNDEMARACALALKFSHIGYGLGRIVSLEKELQKGGRKLFASRRERKGAEDE